MPLYEYECGKCGRRFEKIERVTAPPRQKCPRCGGRAERVLAASAIQFKGSGWYVTDYARKAPAAAQADDKADKGEAKEAKGAKEAKEGKETPAKESGKKSRKEK